MYVYIYAWRLGLCCSRVCLAQLVFTFFGGTGSPTEPESYQVSFFRQAILWALGSTYPCLIGMFHHKWNFTCIWGGCWTPILMFAWQALYRLSHIPSFQPENVKIKRKVLVKQKIQYILLDPNALIHLFLITHMLKISMQQICFTNTMTIVI